MLAEAHGTGAVRDGIGLSLVANDVPLPQRARRVVAEKRFRSNDACRLVAGTPQTLDDSRTYAPAADGNDDDIEPERRKLVAERGVARDDPRVVIGACDDRFRVLSRQLRHALRPALDSDIDRLDPSTVLAHGFHLHLGRRLRHDDDCLLREAACMRRRAPGRSCPRRLSRSCRGRSLRPGCTRRGI